LLYVFDLVLGLMIAAVPGDLLPLSWKDDFIFNLSGCEFKSVDVEFVEVD